MKIMFFALTIAVLIMPQFGLADGSDSKGADEEYMLLLKYSLETVPVSPAEAHLDKASEAEQQKKIIITIIPDSSCLLPRDCGGTDGK